MALFRPYRRWWSPLAFGILFLPMLAHLIPSVSADHNQGARPTVFPELFTEPRKLLALSKAMDAYLEDSFGGRDLVIRANGHLRYALGSPSSRRVALGTDGWLYFADERVLEQTKGTLLRRQNVESLVTLLSDINARLRRDGRTFVAALMPNKHSVQIHTLPAWAKNHDTPTEYDLFLDRMSHHGLPTVDVRTTLRLASRDEPVFRKTDTHWNRLGALLAFNAVVSAAGQPDWTISRPSTLGPLMDKPSGDLARFLGIQGALKDFDQPLLIPDPVDKMRTWGNHPQRSYEVRGENSNGKTVLIIGDSFSRNFFRPYFSPNVARLAWVHHHTCRFDWSVIDRFNPDVVLFLMVERGVGWCDGHRPLNMPA